MIRIRLTAVACALAVLTGCTTMADINHKSLADYAKTQQQVSSTLTSFHGKNHAVEQPSIMSNMPYVNTHSVNHNGTYPSSFFEPATLNSPSQRVWVLMQRIQSMTGIAVQTDDDLLDGASSGGNLPPAPSGAMDSTLMPPSAGGSSVGGQGGAGRAFIGPISYQGTMKGLLDTIAGNMDATWSYDANTRAIHFFRYETRTFHIATVPGDATTTSSIDSGSSSGVQGGQGQTMKIAQSKTNTQFEGKLSVWSTLQTNLKPMLSRGGSISISEPTASITVRDRWDRVEAISKFIQQMNKSLATQVEVNVTVYRVHAADSDNRGINWSVLYNALGQSASTMGVHISTPRPTASGLSSLILNTPTVRPDGTTPPFSGSQFFLDALSTLGKTSVVTNASVETVNNTPAPLKVIQTTAYVAQTTSLLTTGVSSGTSGVVGAGATLTPGQVETGFTMQVLPSVQEDGHRLLLQVMLSLSTLDSLPSFSSGGETIQLPQVSAREFMQRVWMKSGQALVLAGFQNTEADNTTQTPLSKSLWAFGGNRAVNRAHDALVIVITPVASSPQTTL